MDVAVLGGGIAGITTALLLKNEGVSVAVVEARSIGGGVTGYTTAKVTSLHGLTYARLASRLGEYTARVYGEANEWGLARVAGFVEELAIDCDFRRTDAFTYAESRDDLPKIEEEVDRAARLGLPASFVEEADLPFPIAGAVRFSDQAEFHPVKYVRALAAAVDGDGCHLFEGTRALDVEEDTPCHVQTEHGVIRADHVVVATHFPFLDRGLFFARMHPERSYVVAARIAGDTPQGMYLSTEKPAHSLRAHPGGDGELLLVGGESHKTGKGHESERYAALERYARQRFTVESVDYRWATQDNMPVDGLPYVGRLTPLSKRIHVATGFRKWGLANGTAAARMIADAILERQNAWAEVFDPNRVNVTASAPSFAQENADVAFHFFADRLTRRSPAEGLEPGEGRIVGVGLRQLALHRDEEGRLHSLSARCTHLGCIVKWNDAERTWDCPCHGSRFGADGRVIQGPAVRPLPPQPDH